MNLLLKISIVLIWVCLNSNSYAQDHTHDGHSHGDHNLHKSEIGIANALVYFGKEKSWEYGLHVHAVHTISNSKWGLGLGFEQIFDEHEHSTLGLVVNYRPIAHLSFIASPGLSFEEGKASDGTPALHLEASYEIELKNFHLGPVVEWAYDKEDYHISLGIHLGYGF